MPLHSLVMAIIARAHKSDFCYFHVDFDQLIVACTSAVVVELVYNNVKKRFVLVQVQSCLGRSK